MFKGLLIIGFGGHARSVADVALTDGIKSLLFIEENMKEGEQFLGFPVQREFNGAIPEGWLCMPAIGENRKRERQVEVAQSSNWQLATLISPRATIGAGAIVSSGSFVGHHAHVGPMAKVGMGCIINTSAVVEHECEIGNYTHISVNATVAGRTRIGNFVFVGAGVVIRDGISICDDVIIGAGATVIDDINTPGTYIGTPANKYYK